MDTIPVLRQHLEDMASALDLARGHFMALDLADKYRTAGKPRQSRATAMAERGLQHALGYLNVPEEDDDV